MQQYIKLIVNWQTVCIIIMEIYDYNHGNIRLQFACLSLAIQKIENTRKLLLWQEAKNFRMTMKRKYSEYSIARYNCRFGFFKTD